MLTYIPIRNYKLFLLILFACALQASCKKYLDEKKSQLLAVPTTLKDLQALLDNQSFNGASAEGLEFLADNWYYNSARWNAETITTRTAYLWNGTPASNYGYWSGPYNAIYQCNFVLDLLPGIAISASERTNYDNIKGTAMFYRSLLFYQIAQAFCKPYSATAGVDPGIVLRTTSAIEAKSTRATVEQTYRQIIADLKLAAELLPRTVPFATRPTDLCCFALLARVYLLMGDYANAGIYADKVLAEKNILLDYASLQPANSPELPPITDNPEILFIKKEYMTFLEPSNNNVDTILYRSFNDNDLRKKVFFQNGSNLYWKGCYVWDYTGIRHAVFNGLAIDEMYLIRAECKARQGGKDEAMADLNTLLQKRWKSGTFTNLVAADANDALNKVLEERRKELAFRGLRWPDLRRFNLGGAGITLKRVVNNTTYTLPPNDNRWVLLIPDEEIARSGIAQNPR